MHEGTKILLGTVAGGALAWIGWVSLSIHDFSSGNVINGRQDDDIRELRATIQDLTVLFLQLPPPMVSDMMVSEEPVMLPAPGIPGSAGPAGPGGPPPESEIEEEPVVEPVLMPVPPFDDIQRSLEGRLRMRGIEPAAKGKN